MECLRLWGPRPHYESVGEGGNQHKRGCDLYFPLCPASGVSKEGCVDYRFVGRAETMFKCAYEHLSWLGDCDYFARYGLAVEVISCRERVLNERLCE